MVQKFGHFPLLLKTSPPKGANNVTYLSDSFGKTSRAWKAVLLEKT
jgi:hypothetical protein